MKKIIGAIIISMVLCLAGALTIPAVAQTAAKHHHKVHAKTPSRARVRKAQAWLVALGYNPGPIDGIMGMRTKVALVVFARDRDLPQTGRLTDAVYGRLEKEATAIKPNPKTVAIAPPPKFYAVHPDFYGYINPDYADANMLTSPQPIPSRFGTMEVSATQTGLTREYTVTLNGQPVFHAQGQPSAINVSRTFLGKDVDAVIFTAYVPGDGVCPYRHSLLVLRPNSNGVYDIADCSRAYQAYTESGSLYIYFPGSHVDGWSSGDMWRYEHGTLEKL